MKGAVDENGQQGVLVLAGPCAQIPEIGVQGLIGCGPDEPA